LPRIVWKKADEPLPSSITRILANQNLNAHEPKLALVSVAHKQTFRTSPEGRKRTR
jgi:hypothetical protein